jgi:hypothetical protein
VALASEGEDRGATEAGGEEAEARRGVARADPLNTRRRLGLVAPHGHASCGSAAHTWGRDG